METFTNHQSVVSATKDNVSINSRIPISSELYNAYLENTDSSIQNWLGKHRVGVGRATKNQDSKSLYYLTLNYETDDDNLVDCSDSET